VTRAVFVDRDGVINENRPDHVKNLGEFVLLPNALEGLRLLSSDSMRVVVVSNQSAVNRGLVSRAMVDHIHYYLTELVCSMGGRIDAIYYCPHRPDENCDCRKPRPGMLLSAAQQLGIDLTRSYLVGDAVSDVQAALSVGVQPLMVLTGRGKTHARSLARAHLPHIPLFQDLLDAAAWILKREHRPAPSMYMAALHALDGRPAVDSCRQGQGQEG
jgi:D-glycero-D-manno-heptose 1,7-bisphosphate phosphatase